MSKKTICVDFDGVIHKYSEGWKDGEIYDGPVEGAFEKLRMLSDRGFKVVIFTVRGRKARSAIEFWMRSQGTPDGIALADLIAINVVEVTEVKPPAIAYIDDRGIRFTNWEDVVKYFI